MKLERPDWKTIGTSTGRLPLHNNVCVDNILLEKTQDLIQSFDAGQVYRYPEEYDIYKSVSDYHEISIKNIAIGLGATDIINRLIFLAKDEKVIIISPTFEMVKVYCEMYEARFIEIHYTDFNNFNIDNIEPGYVIYVANPNGNNGHVFSKDEIRYMLKISKLVLLDEAYIDYSSTDSILPIIDNYDNLVIINTFSKSLGLAGVRCGYCFASSKIIQQIQDIRMNYVSTGFTSHLIRNLIHEVPDVVERMIQSREYLQNRFDSIDSNGNYCILRGCEEVFDFCHYKNLSDSVIRVTLTNKNVFEHELRHIKT